MSQTFTSLLAPGIAFFVVSAQSGNKVGILFPCSLSCDWWLLLLKEELHITWHREVDTSLGKRPPYAEQWNFEVVLHSSYWNPGQRGIWGVTPADLLCFESIEVQSELL